MESLTSALQEQLSFDRDTDSLTTTPSSSSLDTCSSQKIFNVFNQSSGSPVHQETNVAGEAGEAGEGSGSSFSETDGYNEEEPKIAHSATEGELRHRVLSPLSHHGVSTEEALCEDCCLCRETMCQLPIMSCMCVSACNVLVLCFVPQRACSFGGFDLTSRSAHALVSDCETTVRN